MELNVIDLLLAALILLSLFLGWRRGFLLDVFDLLSWLVGLWTALQFYQPAALWLTNTSGWSPTWSRPGSFLVIFFVTVIILRALIGPMLSAAPPKAHRHPANRMLGLLPGLANGLIHAVIAAALLMAMPLPVALQSQARDSVLNNRFAGYAEVVESRLRPVFDDAINETLNMRTVRPQSKEMVKLPFSVKQSRSMPALEMHMLELVNKERKEAGLRPLIMDAELTSVARKHSADMLARGYFSHYSPEGKSAFDRLRAERVTFLIAGENLAFAPTVRIAHTGLMNSPGHRENILRPQFGKVGIGIMDAGSKGIMVTQQFSN